LIINVPFKFQVDGLRKDRQRAAKYEMWEIAEIDIPVISEDDAPVAVTWDDRFPELLRPDRYAPAQWGSHSADGSAHTVYYDNSHWVALNDSSNSWSPGPGSYDPLFFDGLARKLAVEGECPVLGSHGYDAKAKKQVAECNNDVQELFWDVNHSTREHRLRDLLNKASDLIVVGERLYRKCIEPQFWIMEGIVSPDRTTAGEITRVALLRLATDDNASKIPCRLIFSDRKTYSLGEIDEAITVTRSFNERRRYGVEADLINEAGRPLISHTMAFDEATHIRSRTRELYGPLAKEFWQIPLGQMTKSTSRLFLTLDDLLTGIGDEEGLLKFEEAAFALHSDLLNTKSAQHRLSSLTEDLVDLLENRDISIGSAIDPVKRNVP
jgi:hypothetical protein